MTTPLAENSQGVEALCAALIKGREHAQPEPISADTLLVLKVVVVVLFIAATTGALRALRDGLFSPVEAVLFGGFHGLVCGALALLGAAGLWFGGLILLA